MNYFKQSWVLFFASLKIFSHYKRLIIFPLLSLLFGLSLFVLIFGLMIYFHFQGRFSMLWTLEHNPPHRFIYIFYFLIYYFCFHFISHLLSGGLLIYLWRRLQNHSISMLKAFGMAAKNWRFIIQWIFLFTLMNVTMLSFERRDNWLGMMSQKMFGLTWRLSSVLAFPILIIEKKGAIDALRLSAKTIQSFWGERIRYSLSFALIFWFFLLPLIPLLYVIFHILSADIKSLLAGIIGGYIVLLTVVYSVLHAIFQLSLYGYITTKELPKDFKADWLENVFW